MQVIIGLMLLIIGLVVVDIDRKLTAFIIATGKAAEDVAKILMKKNEKA